MSHYLLLQRWAAYAKTKSADDVLMVDDAENVAEASVANLFAVIDGRLVTPPDRGNIFPGLTRQTIISRFGADVRNIPLAQLSDASEVFICGTYCGVTPVLSVGNFLMGSASVAMDIKSDLDRLARLGE